MRRGTAVNTQHILVIEPPAPNQAGTAAGEILRAHGYQVVCMAPTDALKNTINHFDLLLVYHIPPALDVFSLVAELRDTQASIPPVIMLAADTTQALLLQAMRASIYDCLHYPVDYEQLLTAVRRVTNRPQAHLLQMADMLQQTTDAIIVLNDDKHILFCNKAARAICDIEAEENIIGRSITELVDHPGLVALCEQPALTPDAVRRTEITLESSGSTLNAQLTPLPGQGRVIILQDITHLKALDKIKSEFVERVSRDIRSPLTTIQGYVELIERMGPVNEQQRQFINRIIFAVQSITALLSDLLELGRIEAGFEADSEPTHFAMVLRYALEGAQQTLTQKKLQLEITLPEEASIIMGNPLRLRQMVDNLLDNAIKFTPENGRIHVTLSVQDTFLVLQIADTGIGIPAEDQPHVYNKFYRATNTRDRFKGAGLGLSIVKGIVDKHNGRIWLESHEHKGTSFTIMLPLQSDHPKSVEIAP